MSTNFQVVPRQASILNDLDAKTTSWCYPWIRHLQSHEHTQTYTDTKGAVAKRGGSFVDRQIDLWRCWKFYLFLFLKFQFVRKSSHFQLVKHWRFGIGVDTTHNPKEEVSDKLKNETTFLQTGHFRWTKKARMYVMSPGHHSQVVFCHVTQVQRSAIQYTYEEWNGTKFISEKYCGY